jgi:ribosomal protein S6--L-glutamate ligase
MILSFHPVFDADQQIIFGSRSLNDEDMGFIRKAKAILLPQTCKYTLYKACQGSPAFVFPNYDMRFKYSGKIGQSLLFKELELPAPRTLEWTTVIQLEEYIKEKDSLPHKTPFFLKTNRGHEAEGVFLIENQEMLERGLKHFQILEKSGTFGFISQEYIQSQGNVLRTVILNKTLITYWKRPQTPEQKITTINRGAIIDKEWRKDLQANGKQAAERLMQKTGINLAAIDFVFDLTIDDPGPLFLEINYSFGRRGLGGSENFYGLLHTSIIEWMEEKGLDPKVVKIT